MPGPLNPNALHYSIPLNYLSHSEPLKRSRFGIAAFILSLIAVLPELSLLLAMEGAALIAHDPNGDPGGPLFLLGFAAFSLLLAVVFALLWLLGINFAVVGLIRTRGRCCWSRVAVVLYVLILGGGILAAWLIG